MSGIQRKRKQLSRIIDRINRGKCGKHSELGSVREIQEKNVKEQSIIGSMVSKMQNYGIKVIN